MSSEDFQAETTEVETYSLDSVVPVPGFDTVPAGTNVLVSGAPMLGKQRLTLELLATGSRKEHAVAISPDTGEDRLRSAYEDVGGNSENFHVVDCTGATGKNSMADTKKVKYVSTPADLTGIGMGIVKCTRDIGAAVDDGLRLSILSLSTINQYSSAQRMFNFLHTVTGRVSAAEYLGVGTVDPTRHDDQNLNTITSLFDAVVELREADDGSREIRVVGWPESPRTWQPL